MPFKLRLPKPAAAATVPKPTGPMTIYPGLPFLPLVGLQAMLSLFLTFVNVGSYAEINGRHAVPWLVYFILQCSFTILLFTLHMKNPSYLSSVLPPFRPSGLAAFKPNKAKKGGALGAIFLQVIFTGYSLAMLIWGITIIVDEMPHKRNSDGGKGNLISCYAKARRTWRGHASLRGTACEIFHVNMWLGALISVLAGVWVVVLGVKVYLNGKKVNAGKLPAGDVELGESKQGKEAAEEEVAEEQRVQAEQGRNEAEEVVEVKSA